MKKLVFLSIFTLFGIYTIHSQNSNILSNDYEISQKDWDDISYTQYAIGLRTKKKKTIPQIDFIQNYKDSILLETPKNQLSDTQLAKMPVYEPKGEYNMKIYEIDSTIQFYIKIHEPN
ncbi:hypothetical protein [Maribacter arcticus]|uniref:Uncharacterized protein n=1 Tax=Maribacter arcticus TaxID=561365 RepID=A0A1T5EVT8_9FLAO|nr:hypothetical protein [Maribacter arcticus]SKB88082.1 hypothetical protein SAMN05660866_03739 [Maribacter arcticus]